MATAEHSRMPEPSTADMVCILGPTATGKTRVAVALASLLTGEVISADSRQVFRRMNIGTGKDLEEYGAGAARVPYHLIDIVEPGSEFSVFEFQTAFYQAYADIRSRNRFPILCGGTGLYIDSVLSRYHMVPVPHDNTLRGQLERESDDQLVARLAKLRPLHNTTDTGDRDRLVRAIEIAVHSQRESEPGRDLPEIRTTTYGLTLPRPVLKQRIARRLRDRLQQGLVEEVRGLLDSGLAPTQLEFYGLEYRLVTQHLCGKLTSDDMAEQLSAAIGQFARRQEKWFRRMERKGTRIVWLDADLPADVLASRIAGELTTESGSRPARP